MKAGLVTLDGRLLGLARTGYRTDTDAATGRAEQDPEAWWGALATSVRRLRRSAAAEVIAVAVDGHGPTLVAVDAAGRPTRPAIIWQDSRATAEAAELAAATGLAGWSLAGLPAALWVERNEPAVAAATCWYLATWDFLALRLTGRAATSLVEGQPFPAAAVLDGPGVPAAKVPPAVRAGDVVGELTPAAADHLRLAAGIPVVAGLVDAWASFHGAGMTAKGDAIDVGGAAGGFGVVLGPAAGRARQLRDDRAAARTVQRRRGDGRDRPGDRLVPDPDRCRRRLDRGAARGGRRDAARRRGASSSCRTSPASARRSGTRRRGARSSG